MKQKLFLFAIILFFIVSCKEEKEEQEKADQPVTVEEVNEADQEESPEEFVEEFIEGKEESPIKGGKVKILLTEDPRHLNPAIQSGSGVGLISSQIFASLLRIDRDWKLHPNLARDWEVSEDGMQIKFYLQEDAYFHDMEKITVEDVAFSFEVVKKYHQFITMLSSVINVEKISEKVGIIHLEQPSPVILTALASPMVPIIPKHIYGDGQDIKTHPANMEPVGSGPFKFISWKSENEILLKRFDNYFLPELPYLDEIVYKFYKDESTSMAFENKAVDIVGFIAEKDIFSLSSKEDLKHLYKDSKGYGGIGPIMWLAFNTIKPPFDDVRVRQAIAYGIDREVIARTLHGNNKYIATGPLYPGTPFYTNDHNLYDVDYDKANKMLDDAGYERDENGVRFSVKLDPLILQLCFKSADYIEFTLEKRLGIEVDVYSDNSFPNWVERISNHEFDLALDLVYNWGDPVIGVHRTYSSANIKKGVIWSNTQSYSNPEVDRILDKANIENDFNKRKALYFELQKILAEDLPVYPLSTNPYVTIYNRQLKNMNNNIWGLMFPLDRVYWGSK